MRIKHGKVVFGYKDTFDANCTLAPIIHNWLVKFKNTLVEQKDCGFFVGVPSKVMNDLFPDQSHDSGWTNDQINTGLEHWLKLLDVMIYAFENKEPEYNGSFIMNNEKQDKNGLKFCHISPDNDEAWKQYIEDCVEHEKKVQYGYNLFGNYFSSMWW